MALGRLTCLFTARQASGETATTHKVTEYLEADAIEAGVNLTVFSINCNKRDTTYKVITHLANELYSEKTFKQGHHPDTLWDRIYTALDELGEYSCCPRRDRQARRR